MTIIFVAENNINCLAVIFKNNGLVRVQKFQDVSDDINIIYEVNPINAFFGKSQLCNMTEFSGAEDKEVLNGNTILLEIARENDKNKYVYIGGDKVCSFLTNDKIYKYISNMGNNLCPYSIAFGWENIYYISPYFIYINKKYIDVDDIDKLFDNSNVSNYKQIKTHKIFPI